MSSILLKEYRCSCGKLLFKGVLAFCLVQVKCRRCGSVQLADTIHTDVIALVRSDASNRVVEVSGNVGTVFGCDPQTLMGKNITELYPALADGAHVPREQGGSDGRVSMVPHHVCIVDGAPFHLSSHITEEFRDGAFSGYRILNWPGENVPLSVDDALHVEALNHQHAEYPQKGSRLLA